MRLVDVGVRYGRKSPWVLRSVDRVLAVGDIVAVTGRNGAGKSTLLRVLAGHLRPGRGRIEGRPPVIGWVPEEFPADQPFDAWTYLRSLAAVRGLDRERAGSVIERLAERLGFRPFLRAPLRDLSKGTARKVGLTQALLVPPGLLVMDEPWDGLDAETQAELPRLFAEVAAAGGIVVLTDHRSGTAAARATREWRVREGRVNEVTPGEAGTPTTGRAVT